MKKILTAVLASLFILMQVPTTFAASNTDPLSLDSISSEANKLVSIALEQCIIPGQESGQINHLYLSNSIPLYEVNSDNTLIEMSTIKYYPLLDQNDIVRGLIVARLQTSNAAATLEYNTMFCTELTAYMKRSSSICFIFDQTGIYIFDGDEYTVVLQDSVPDMSRGIFYDAGVELSHLERNSIVAEAQCNSLSTHDPSVSGILSVPIIDQDDWSNGCWAASAVSMGQYAGSGTLTIDDVMKSYADGKNVTKTILDIQNVLAKEFGVNTSLVFGKLMMTTVIDNIKVGINNGDPILARVAYSTVMSGHFIVVCGFTSNTAPGTSYITIMDPLSHAYRTLPTERNGIDSEFLYTKPNQTEKFEVNMYLTIK